MLGGFCGPPATPSSTWPGSTSPGSSAGGAAGPGCLRRRRLHPAVDELIKPDRLAAGRVQCFTRNPTGRPGDDGAKICLLDQRVHVDTTHNVTDINAIDHGVHVHLVDQGVHVHPVKQGVQV